MFRIKEENDIVTISLNTWDNSKQLYSMCISCKSGNEGYILESKNSGFNKDILYKVITMINNFIIAKYGKLLKLKSTNDIDEITLSYFETLNNLGVKRTIINKCFTKYKFTYTDIESICNEYSLKSCYPPNAQTIEISVANFSDTKTLIINKVMVKTNTEEITLDIKDMSIAYIKSLIKQLKRDLKTLGMTEIYSKDLEKLGDEILDIYFNQDEKNKYYYVKNRVQSYSFKLDEPLECRLN